MSDVDKDWARAGMEEVREGRQTKFIKFAFMAGFNIHGCPSYLEYYFSKSTLGLALVMLFQASLLTNREMGLRFRIIGDASYHRDTPTGRNVLHGLCSLWRQPRSGVALQHVPATG